MCVCMSNDLQAFTAPAMVLSAVMVEAYKKYVLVSLLVHGRVGHPPKYTSSIVQRHLKSLCPQYQEFINAFSTSTLFCPTTHPPPILTNRTILDSTDEVHKVAEQHAEAFTKDNNFGLVKQCIQLLYRRNIGRQTQTYLTLSLDAIASSVKLNSAADAEKAVLRMIEDGKIFAQINQKDGMVAFQEDPEKYDTPQMQERLDQEIHKAMDLARTIKKIDREIASSRAYLEKTTMHERGGGGMGRWGDFDDYDTGHGGPGGGFLGGRKGGRRKGRHGA